MGLVCWKMKKEIDLMFIEELWNCILVESNMGVLNHFVEECVGSIQLRGIGAFGSIRTFLVKKIIYENSKIF